MTGLDRSPRQDAPRRGSTTSTADNTTTTQPSTRYAPPVVREWTTSLTSDAGVTFFGDSELVIRAVHYCKGDRAVCDAQPTECGHRPTSARPTAEAVPLLVRRARLRPKRRRAAADEPNE